MAREKCEIHNSYEKYMALLSDDPVSIKNTKESTNLLLELVSTENLVCTIYKINYISIHNKELRNEIQKKYHYNNLK